MDREAITFEKVSTSLIVLTTSDIQDRLDAVEEFKDSTNYKVNELEGLLTRLPDLEKGLVRIHYGRVPLRRTYCLFTVYASRIAFYSRSVKASRVQI
jgi:DNA mismatch repair ATPase MutS